MLRRSFSLLAASVAALALAGCGGGEEADEPKPAGETAAPTSSADEASVLVTRDCGRDVVVAKETVPAGLTAMQGLKRVADVDTDFGGKFVTAIEGVEQNEKRKLAWLLYLTGRMAKKGAVEGKLEPGDVEGWDLHDYTRTCHVPAAAR